MNWRERLRSIQKGASLFTGGAVTLLWDLAHMSSGIHEAIVSVSTEFGQINEETNKNYDFDERTFRNYTVSLLELHALSRLIHLTGMSVFHDDILNLEIRKKFGPPASTSPVHIDSRDMSKLAASLREAVTTTSGYERRETESVDSGRGKRAKPKRRSGGGERPIDVGDVDD